LIGVFVNPSIETLQRYSPFLDGIQLHGEESSEKVQEIKRSFPSHILWKAFRPQNQEDLKLISEYPMVDGVLVDGFSAGSYGGTGKTVLSDFLPLLRSHLLSHQKLFLAGGITVHNASKILKSSKADGVDLSSSLENSPGNKSEKKVSVFFENFSKENILVHD